MIVTKAIPGIERFYYKYPNYPDIDMCGWRKAAIAEGPIVEGRLEDCLECDGRKYDCGNYTGRI